MKGLWAFSPRLEVVITHLGRKHGVRDMNTSGLIMPGVGLANHVSADGGMAHSPYTKRDSLYIGYTLGRYSRVSG